MPLNDNFVYAPPQDPLSILFEDDDLIVVDKPAGLLSVMGRLPEHHDSAYLRVLEKFPLAKVTHRLDMATSGLLMFAKHRDAEVAVSKMFQARTVKKHYIDKFFSDSSLLDPVLFKKITRVIDNLAVLEDFSIRLIEVITKKDDKNIPFKARVNGFERLYNEKSIEIEEALNDLYFYCTSKELTRSLFPKC